MARAELETQGFAFYVDQLRTGRADAYVAYRLYEQSWHLPRGEALLRRATICLIERDPWFLVTAMPYFLHALTTEDLQRLTPLVGVGPTSKASAMLRARLWYWSRKGPYHPDRTGLAQLRKALGFLKAVPPKQRDVKWREMVVGCYRKLDYQQYKRAFGQLLTMTPPESRADPLNDFLDVVAAKRDWRTFDRYRREWDVLPASHHACQCYVNNLHTNDGLRSAAASRWDAIPDALSKAAAVRGCPHLNTGGLRLDLARLLIAKRRHLDAVRDYLERAVAFEGGRDAATKLRRGLDGAARRSTR